MHCHVGTIYAMQGRYNEAAYEFLQAVNYFENFPLCYYIVNAVGYGPARPSMMMTHERPVEE